MLRTKLNTTYTIIKNIFWESALPTKDIFCDVIPLSLASYEIIVKIEMHF